MKNLSIIAICGSLRKQSFNRMALEVARAQAPEGMAIEIAEIGDLPHYSQDIEQQPPQSVHTFREKVKAADGILFGVAEYNYSVSSVLKNAIEWGSRPYGNAVMNSKPVAMMGVSNGMLGTARAQYHLRQICVQVEMHAMHKPEVMIPFGQEKFSEDGTLHDEKTLQKIKDLLSSFSHWIHRLQR